MNAPSITDCFVLLDDSSASLAEPRSRLHTGLTAHLCCNDPREFAGMLEQMQTALRSGLHAIGLFSYELGAKWMGVCHAESRFPLAQVLLFERCERLSAGEVGQWLQQQAANDDIPAGIVDLRANVDEHEFAAAIGKIHDWIESGDTYQVNYTTRLRFDAFGSPIALYRRLRERQPVPYGALAVLPDGCAVLSLSPELFIRHERGLLTARPMKGTAPASGDPALDTETSAALAGDAKNRAENLMIVDLLRNDFGRIAETGSVAATALFDVKRFGSVLQMTSTVSARLRGNTALAEVFAAIFPCGSITGAPKRRTMEIIRAVEPDARGLYTGAIGWFDAAPDKDTVGDFCLSVPIRTLLLQPPDPGGIRRGEMGVGAGIVHDSKAEEEYAECLLKARFLTALPQTFELIETMLATRAGCRHWPLHLRRLQASARYFGFGFDEAVLNAAVQQACSALPDGEFRLRLTLGSAGFDMQTAPLAPLSEPVKLFLASEPTSSGDLFLRHKTTVRQRYDAAWREAEQQGAFDSLFFNERGELTEGGRSNVFVQLGGRWVTPPLSAGLLPGVMRSVLLADPAWNATEQTLTQSDLRRAEAVVVCNALRGVLNAKVVFPDKKRAD